MTGDPPARVGLIVNPIAGMGGRVGLKGTDGEETLQRARALGAAATAPLRADVVERALVDRGVDVQRVTPMSAAGTREAAAAFGAQGVDLLLFVGGDGTARDVCTAVDAALPAVGVPAGVKMHSGVFATSPRTAAEIVVAWLALRGRPTREAEIVDVDEAALRDDRMEVRLYGTLRVPDVPGGIQALKASGVRVEADELAGLAAEVIRQLEPGSPVILGPGTTTQAVGRALGLKTTLLGIDVIEVDSRSPAGSSRIVVADGGATQILAAIPGRSGPAAKAVLSPTGGQGFLLGRGNQQLSPAVLRAIGPSNVIVVATPRKLAALGVQPLLVDTGDADVDAAFAGYRRVITGPGRESVVRVMAG